MKGKGFNRTGAVRFGDVLQNFTSNQLAGIGAVAMLYNAIEASLRDLFAACVTFPGSSNELSSKIEPSDLCTLIASAIKHFQLPDEIVRQPHPLQPRFYRT